MLVFHPQHSNITLQTFKFVENEAYCESPFLQCLDNLQILKKNWRHTVPKSEKDQSTVTAVVNLFPYLYE